ncbi:MAG: rhodanese-like domain-containing protein [Allosphingosinicella sp.]
MMRSCLALALACAAAPLAAAAPRPSAPPAAAALPVPQIDYASFRQLTAEIEPYRLTRLIDWEAFVAAAEEPDVLILDARSERQFARGHIEGAVNVPLPEFSVQRLAEVIGRQDRPILIYCNNNFLNNVEPVISKAGPVALNIPTFIHLVAYGYRNVRELDDTLDFNDPQVRWVSNSTPAGPGRARH